MKFCRVKAVLFISAVSIGAVYADDMQGMKMDNMDMNNKSMPMQDMKPQLHHAKGVVKTIDAANGKITIAHEPVATLKWPAMTMTFAITKDQLAAIAEGNQVQFDFVMENMQATITHIQPVK